MTLLNGREAASALRLSERTLERLRLRGDGPRYCKIGRRVVYPQCELDSWVLTRLVASTSEGEAHHD
jgi:predicted DNA-binding transcriptional regulator AlpA